MVSTMTRRPVARLGVATIVLVEPDRIEEVNLPRMPEARHLDAIDAASSPTRSRLDR